jgi:hypothetical protein
MKKLLLMGCILLGAALATFAQGGGRTPQTPEQQTATLKTAVTLTDAQEPKVLAIYKMQAASMDSLAKAVPDPQTARPLRMPIQARYTAMIKALLTPDQVAKMPAGRGGRGGGGAGGGGGTPPPPTR